MSLIEEELEYMQYDQYSTIMSQCQSLLGVGWIADPAVLVETALRRICNVTDGV